MVHIIVFLFLICGVINISFCLKISMLVSVGRVIIHLEKYIIFNVDDDKFSDKLNTNQ